MGRVFKDFVDETASKAADQSAKAEAAKKADQDLIDAQTATGQANSAELSALQAIGGDCDQVNDDGTITRFFTDKTSPTGYSTKVVPDAATAVVPDPATPDPSNPTS